ncbi:hypothetical protein P20495_0635 [Pseudoalteromonas sp. BSi20495]|nr:hypothetical protein P20495_0635 [Pseudoalteromonas sp. BSi20495]
MQTFAIFICKLFMNLYSLFIELIYMLNTFWVVVRASKK